MKIKNLTVRRETYRGSREVFSGLNLNLSGRVNVIYGSPGAGKSTLLEVIAGLISPSSGSVTDGTAGPRYFLMQVPERQFIYGTCREEIKKSGGSLKKAAEIFGIPENIMDIPPWSLSKGERKKLLLAGLFFKKNRHRGYKKIVLDDPFRDLDQRGIDMVTEYFIKPEVNKVIMATANSREFNYLKTKAINFDIINLNDIKK